MAHAILVIEDDLSVQSYISNVLIEEGFVVRSTDKGIAGLQIVENSQPDLVILDLELPDMQGESVCMELKKNYPELPVIMLTGRVSLADKVAGFSVGADDYITKPFAPEELVVRVKARLRTAVGSSVLKVADLELDSKKVTVSRAGKVLSLSPLEFRLLEYLMQNSGIVLSREMILNRVWAYSFDVESRVVDVYVGYLRKKIDSKSKEKLIHSVRGFGYVLKASQESAA